MRHVDSTADSQRALEAQRRQAEEARRAAAAEAAKAAKEGQKPAADNNKPLDTNNFIKDQAQPDVTTAGPKAGQQLANRIHQNAILKQGNNGPEVQELQQLLNRSGANPPLETDGKFGPKTEQALRQFQQTSGIKVDGKFGPQSLGSLAKTTGSAHTSTVPSQLSPAGQNKMTQALGNPAAAPTNPSAPAADPSQPGSVDATNGPTATGSDFAPEAGRANGTFAGSKAEREQQAEEPLKANGQWPPKEGETYAIQIDQDPPPGNASSNDKSRYVRAYTGQTAVFKAVNGKLVEQQGPLRSAAHPGQKSSGLSPDVTGDGRGDVANLPAGVYKYGTQTNYRGRFNPTSNFQGYRDQNQDGTISGSEKDRKHTISAIQIHAGSSSKPSSIGCQTLPPSDYNKFRSAVRNSASGNSTFTYLLVRRPNDRHGANPI